MKVAVVEFGATETLAGIAILPVEVNATVAPVDGGLLKVTVQIAMAPGARDDGVQVSPLRLEIVVAAALAVPTVPLTTNAPPSSAAPREPETPMVAAVTVDANVIDTVATVPLAMRLVLIPVARQT